MHLIEIGLQNYWELINSVLFHHKNGIKLCVGFSLSHVESMIVYQADKWKHSEVLLVWPRPLSPSPSLSSTLGHRRVGLKEQPVGRWGLASPLHGPEKRNQVSKADDWPWRCWDSARARRNEVNINGGGLA